LPFSADIERSPLLCIVVRCYVNTWIHLRHTGSSSSRRRAEANQARAAQTSTAQQSTVSELVCGVGGRSRSAAAAFRGMARGAAAQRRSGAAAQRRSGAAAPTRLLSAVRQPLKRDAPARQPADQHADWRSNPYKPTHSPVDSVAVVRSAYEEREGQQSSRFSPLSSFIIPQLAAVRAELAYEHRARAPLRRRARRCATPPERNRDADGISEQISEHN